MEFQLMDVDDYVEGQKDNSDSNEQGFSVGKVVKCWESCKMLGKASTAAPSQSWGHYSKSVTHYVLLITSAHCNMLQLHITHRNK